MGKRIYIFSRDLSITPLGYDDTSPVLVTIIHNDYQKVYTSLKNGLNNHYPNTFEIIGKPKINLVISLKPDQTIPKGETITTLIHKLDGAVRHAKATLADFELIENNGSSPSLILKSKTPHISVQSFYQKLYAIQKNRRTHLLKIECDLNTIIISLNSNQDLPARKTIRQMVEELMTKQHPQIPYSSYLGHTSNLHFTAETSIEPPIIPIATASIPQSNPPQPSEMIIISDDSEDDIDVDMNIEESEHLELDQLMNDINRVEARIEEQEKQLSEMETQVVSLYSYFGRLSAAEQAYRADNLLTEPPRSSPTQYNFFTSPPSNVEEPCTLEQLETLFFGQNNK